MNVCGTFPSASPLPPISSLLRGTPLATTRQKARKFLAGILKAFVKAFVRECV